MDNSRVNYPLSMSEMTKLNPNVRIISYDELQYIDDIDEMLHPSGCCIILYMQGSNYGHWVCIYVVDDTINFFCPYGYKIDSNEYVKSVEDDALLFETGQIFNILTELLVNSRYDKILYNDEQFQILADDVKTCGRWVTIRLWLRFISDRLFKKFVTYFDDREELVTMLTDNALAEYFIDPLQIIISEK
jgi:hypothetical protein